jgi:nucleoside-diphosphate-sugar epimerase
MSRVLIAGCGYVGRATANLFHSAGWEVEGWTASGASGGRPYAIQAVDLSDRDAVLRTGGSFDAVVQCASSRGGGAEAYRRIYFDAAQNLVAAFPEALLLFTSSTSVYAQSGGEWITELSPAAPRRETGRVLRETEELVLKHNGIVARLGGIYGPGRSALLRKFLAGEAVIDSEGHRFVNQAHRDDIASALVLLVQRPQRGEIFNVTDNHPLPLEECYEWLATALRRPAPRRTDMPAERKRGDSNKRVSSAKLLSCGWSPAFPTFQSGMSGSVLPNIERCGA